MARKVEEIAQADQNKRIKIEMTLLAALSSRIRRLRK